MNDEQLRGALSDGSRELGLLLDTAHIDQLVRFLRLLEKWNRSFNLTGSKSIPELLHAHVLDSLGLLNLLPEGEMLDVGTGAGFPGIPIAICEEDRPIVLLDSNGKKTRFLQQVKAELNLGNVMIVQSRVEAHQPDRRYACIVSRAVASVNELGGALLPLLDPRGCLLLMKGSEYQEELAEIPPGLEIESVKTVTVPGKELPRHVLIFHKAANGAQ